MKTLKRLWLQLLLATLAADLRAAGRTREDAAKKLARAERWEGQISDELEAVRKKLRALD